MTNGVQWWITVSGVAHNVILLLYILCARTCYISSESNSIKLLCWYDLKLGSINLIIHASYDHYLTMTMTRTMARNLLPDIHQSVTWYKWFKSLETPAYKYLYKANGTKKPQLRVITVAMSRVLNDEPEQKLFFTLLISILIIASITHVYSTDY